jgi:hypothetical protein
MQQQAFTLQKTNVVKTIRQSRTLRDEQMVRMLFHGTTHASIQSIVNNPTAGFIPVAAGTRVGTVWGKGTYFARDASYSHEYTEELNGERTMLLNEVLVGEWTLGAPNIAVCPKVPGSESRSFNSLVDDVRSPSIFVVQHSNQVYPAYVITYVIPKTKKKEKEDSGDDASSRDEQDGEDESEEEENGDDDDDED